MLNALSNVVENAQSLEGLAVLWFALSCLPGVVGVVVFLSGLYYFFKPYHATNVADIGGAFQGLMSIIGLLGGLVLIGISLAILTSFFGS